MLTAMNAFEHDRLIKDNIMRARHERSKAFYRFLGTLGQALSGSAKPMGKKDMSPLPGGTCKA